MGSSTIEKCFFDSEIPKYLIRDRDSKFSNLYKQSIFDFGINEIITAYRSPWQMKIK